MKRSWLRWLSLLSLVGVVGVLAGKPGMGGFLGFLGFASWNREMTDELLDAQVDRACRVAFTVNAIGFAAVSMLAAVVPAQNPQRAAGLALAALFALQFVSFFVALGIYRRRGLAA